MMLLKSGPNVSKFVCLSKLKLPSFSRQWSLQSKSSGTSSVLKEMPRPVLTLYHPLTSPLTGLLISSSMISVILLVPFLVAISGPISPFLYFNKGNLPEVIESVC